MDSTCDIFKDRPAPLRATYENLFKRPESERECLESIIADVHHDGSVRMYAHPMVVASFMSRQRFLRSYPFTRQEDYKTTCFGCYKAEEADVLVRKRNSEGGRVKCARLRRAKKAACSAVKLVFRHVVSIVPRTSEASKRF